MARHKVEPLESEQLGVWIDQFDNEVAVEIGKLVIAFSYLEYLFISLIDNRLDSATDATSYMKTALVVSDNTFSQTVQLFRALGQLNGLPKTQLTADKKLVKAALDASELRNEVVHAWYFDIGVDKEKIFMYWKKKPTAKRGYSTKAGPLSTGIVRNALHSVLNTISLITESADFNDLAENAERRIDG